MCHETLWHLCVPAADKIIRTVAVYTFLVLGLRVAGKRELAQLKSFDLIVLITLANAVQNAVIGPDNTVTGGLIGATTLLVVNNLVVRLAFRFPGVNALLQGRETVLLADGRVDPSSMRHEMLTESELRTVAGRQGARSLDMVERIALEPNGNVDVVLKDDPAIAELLAEMKELKRLLTERD